MKINELCDLTDEWDRIDAKFNPENFEFRGEELDRYKEIAQLSKGETPVITGEPKAKDNWSNAPKESDHQSPGYRAGESVKKRAGVKYKDYRKFADTETPIANL